MMMLEKECDRAIVVGGKAYGLLHGKRSPSFDESYIVKRGVDKPDGYYDIKAGIWIVDSHKSTRLSAPYWIDNKAGEFVACAQLEELARIAIVASDDETLYFINGVYVTDCSLCATDGRRLVYHGKVEYADEHAIVPINKKVSGIKGELSVYKKYSYMDLGDDEVLYIRNIEGQFPNWPKVLPIDKVVDTIELPSLKWLRMVSKIDKKSTRVTMRNGVWSSDIADIPTVKATNCVADTVVSFNCNYLIDAHKMGCTKMRTHVKGNVEKAVELTCDDDSIMVIAPMWID